MKTTHWLLNRQVLSALLAAPMLLSATAFADEAAPAAVEAAAPAAPAEPASPWTLSANVNFVNNYKARGVSQSWNRPAVQGGFDVSHASGAYAGIWGSSMSSDTFPNATMEFDVYGGYNGTISAVEGLGWTAGVIGVYYPGATWKKYADTAGNKVTPEGGDFTNWEANVGLSYGWFSTKFSYGLTNWYGAEKDTGWDGSTRGSTYIELNAAIPLPVWGLTLIAHAGHSNIAGKLNLNAVSSVTGAFISQGADGFQSEDNPDWSDYKIGLTKAFEIAGTPGWNAGVYWVGATNRDYWDAAGYGGSSFSGSTGSKEPKFLGLDSCDCGEGRLIMSLGRSF